MTEYERKIYKADFDALMERQHGLCASKKCEKIHGKRQRVSTTRDIDHKIAIKIWELKGFKGNPNARHNLQLLCPDCHRRKTAEDKKWISILKKRKKESKKRVTKKKKTAKKSTKKKTQKKKATAKKKTTKKRVTKKKKTAKKKNNKKKAVKKKKSIKKKQKLILTPISIIGIDGKKRKAKPPKKH